MYSISYYKLKYREKKRKNMHKKHVLVCIIHTNITFDSTVNNGNFFLLL